MNVEKRLKIGEVSKLLNIPSYVLRYWENEFSELRPRKSRSGQRLYSEKDLDFIRLIARFRYEEKLTISGCKSRLKSLKARSNQQPVPEKNLKPVVDELQRIKKGLQALLEELR